MTNWQVQTAKQRFSEVVRAARTGEPQVITRHGEPVAVLLDIDDYRRTHQSRPTFTEFLLGASESVGLDDDLLLPERRVDPDRTADLFAEL